MTDDEIHTALLKWVRSHIGGKVIRGEQSGDSPQGNYAMLRLTGTAQVRVNPQNEEFEEDEESERVLARPVIEVEWRFSLHAYGGTPTDHLRPLVSAFHMAQANEPLMPGLQLHELSQIRNLPEFINETWEPRAQMDVILRGLTRDGVLIDTIETHSFEFERN